MITEKTEDNSLTQDLNELKRRMINLFKSMKLQFVPAAMISVIFGTSLSYSKGNMISWNNFILALLGVSFLHISGNMFNDYFDNLNGTDRINKDFIRPFTGGSRVIQDGLMEPYQILVWSVFFLITGSITGVFLLLRTGPGLLLIGLPGIFSIIFYVNKNFSLVSRGLGELTIFLNFSTLPILGAYYVQTGVFEIRTILASIPIGMLITAVLYINEFPDYTADRETGKNNLVVRMGREKAKWGYPVLIGISYIGELYLVIAGIFPIQSLVVFLTIPLSIYNSYLIIKYPDNNRMLIPALPLTILLHLLTGYILSVTLYFGKNIDLYAYILLAPAVLLLIVKTFTQFTNRPADVNNRNSTNG